MKKFHFNTTSRFLSTSLLALALFAGCTDMGDPVSPDANNNPPGDGTLSWTGTIYPDIIGPSCASCHNAASPQGNLDLTTFDGWINATSNGGNPFVVAGTPDDSELVWRVEGTNGVSRMPVGGQLSASDIEAIRTWISQGALKDPVAGEDGGNGGGGDGGDDGTYTWVADIFPDIIQPSCVSCHGPNNPEKGLDLTDFFDWIDEDGETDYLLVNPGNPAQSELVMRLEGNGVGQMPPGFSLATSDIEKVKAWIEQGAVYE